MKTKILAFFFAFATLHSPAQSFNKTVMYEIPYLNVFPRKESQVNFNYETCRQSYYKIILSSFDVAVDKNFIRKYRPIALITVESGDKKFQKVIGDETISYNKMTGSIRSINNSTILDYTAYTGDDIKITVALYKEKTRDRVENTLELVKNLSSIAPFIPLSYVSMADDIYKNVNEYFSNLDPIISYQNTFKASHDGSVDSVFKEGYYLLSNKEINSDDLYYTNNRFEYRTDNITSRLDYILLNFDHQTQIPNYGSKDYGKKFGEALQAATTKDDQKAMRIFKEEVLPKVYSDDNLTVNNKNILHRDFYSQLAQIISKYKENFIVEDYPSIVCFQPNIILAMVAEDTPDNATKDIEDTAMLNRERLDNLLKDVKIDSIINKKIEKGAMQPADLAKEWELLQ